MKEKSKISYVYDITDNKGRWIDDAVLDYEEEEIMKQMRKLNALWKNYKKKPKGNRLILYCGGTGCSMRLESPSANKVIEVYEHITCDGGDGGDHF